MTTVLKFNGNYSKVLRGYLNRKTCVMLLSCLGGVIKAAYIILGEQGGDDDNTEKHGKEDEINEMSDGDDHPDEQSEACDPLEEVKDNENDGLDKPNSIHEDIPEQMENERDETKESDGNFRFSVII